MTTGGNKETSRVTISFADEKVLKTLSGNGEPIPRCSLVTRAVDGDIMKGTRGGFRKVETKDKLLILIDLELDSVNMYYGEDSYDNKGNDTVLTALGESESDIQTP